MEKVLPRDCKLRRVKYLNNVIEQDHRAIPRTAIGVVEGRGFLVLLSPPNSVTRESGEGPHIVAITRLLGRVSTHRRVFPFRLSRRGR